MSKFPLWLSILILLSCQQNLKETFDIIIANVNLIDGNGGAIQTGRNIYIYEGRIIKIDSIDLSEDPSVIDGTGKYLIPGLFDCHVHTSDYEYDLPRLMHYGVTSIFVPGGSTCSNQYFKQIRELGAQDSLPAPRVFHTSQHFTMEGRHPVRTYKSSNWVEGETVFYLRDTLQIESLVQQVVQFPIQGIKLTIEEGPMPPPVPRMPQTFVDKVVAEARKNKTRVFVHVSDNTELRMAIKAGINNIIHYTGVDLDFEVDRTLIDSIYQLNVSWVTTLMIDKSFIYPLHPEWIEQSDIRTIYSASKIGDYKNPYDIVRAKAYLNFFKTEESSTPPTLKDIVTFQVEDIKTLYDNGVNMVLGTDTGNKYIFHGHSLHEEMQLLELGGMPPADIIKMGTHNAAKMLNILDDLGTIESGKMADMILLDRNPLDAIENTMSIHLIIKNGVIQQRMSLN